MSRGSSMYTGREWRLQLASTELEEERLRIAELLLFATAALFFLGIGIVLVTLLVVLLFWDGPRVLVLAAAATLYLALGVGLAAAWRKRPLRPLRPRPPSHLVSPSRVRRAWRSRLNSSSCCRSPVPSKRTSADR